MSTKLKPKEQGVNELEESDIIVTGGTLSNFRWVQNYVTYRMTITPTAAHGETLSVSVAEDVTEEGNLLKV